MKILVVDDEILARERLVNLLAEIDEDLSVTEARNGVTALELINHDLPDLVLLDVRMPRMGGIETAHHINQLGSPPSIIFTTAYQDYALDAFNVHAIDYLMKPIRREYLQQALNRAKALHKEEVAILRGPNRRSHLSAVFNGKLQIVPVEKICFLRASQKYVTAVWHQGELLLNDSLKSLEEEFNDQFIRIHRNTLVALKYVKELSKDEKGHPYITLQDLSVFLPVSRRHVGSVRKALKNL